MDGIGFGRRKRVWLTDAGLADGDGSGVEIKIVPGRRPDGSGGRKMVATQKLKMLREGAGTTSIR